jgi:small conductance mechanosensitive channel
VSTLLAAFLSPLIRGGPAVVVKLTMKRRAPGAARAAGAFWLALVGLLCAAPCASVMRVQAQAQAQAPEFGGEEPAADPPEDAEQAPARVGVRPGVADDAIAERLRRILVATDWFEQPDVRVRDGVVFLQGSAESEQRKVWATELARNTEDVVAVVNQMRIREAPLWDFGPALLGIRRLLREIVLGLPGAAFALLVLIATWLLSRLARAGIERVARRRVRNNLLRRVLARAGAVLVLLLGVYVLLYVSGLTRLAISVLGGTGLIGLILGIAFRDITENFLASLFLSVQQPFRVDDLVEVAGITGYVQRTTFRTTVLMTLNGNQVQVPNATVYKSVIRNFTSNRDRREDFVVGIGVDAPVSTAQEIAQRVLAQHPAVLRNPEPWVLVDSLGSATVQLRIYFWLDGTTHSWLKVRSSVIRLVKRAFQDAGISMPDEAREVVFPRGVPVRVLEQAPEGDAQPRSPAVCEDESTEPVTHAEGQLHSEAAELKRQAEHGRLPDEGENLLAESSGERTRKR